MTYNKELKHFKHILYVQYIYIHNAETEYIDYSLYLFIPHNMTQ